MHLCKITSVYSSEHKAFTRHKIFTISVFLFMQNKINIKNLKFFHWMSFINKNLYIKYIYYYTLCGIFAFYFACPFPTTLSLLFFL